MESVELVETAVAPVSSAGVTLDPVVQVVWVAKVVSVVREVTGVVLERFRRSPRGVLAALAARVVPGNPAPLGAMAQRAAMAVRVVLGVAVALSLDLVVLAVSVA